MTNADSAIAVVGLGCVYPGAADATSFWRNIVTGTDAITTAPPDRIDPRLFASDPSGATDGGEGGDRAGSADQFICNRGGFVRGDALAFEPGRFGIMPVAVEGAEPDQLLALATAAAAVDDAGGLDDIARDRIGVILGRGGYLTPGLVRLDQRVRTANQLLDTLRDLLPDVDDQRLVEVKDAFDAQLGELRPESAIGLVPNLAASRIANRLDLGGPAYTIDAACASSLIAVDAAIGELASGRCDVVLAGGVHHCHDVTLWSVFSQLGALSATGEIRPFSRRADGILVAEGTGVVVLERLADAERLGHRVYATIVGTGVASDGRDASLMSPRVDGQVLALERAYRRAGVDPDTVGLIEGHGTATPAGDRAELETLRRVFGKLDPSDDPATSAVLGSVKSMIGHAMPAAGAAGLIKAILAVHHGVLPPTLHAEDPHPDLDETRFRLLAAAEPWVAGREPRRAGIDAFGFGGINAHVIVEQHGSDRVGAVAPVRGASGMSSAPNGSAVPRATDRPAFAFDALLLQGLDADDLVARLAAWRVDPHRSLDGTPIGEGPARLAIVDPTAKRLDLARRLLDKGRPWRGRNDIWFEPTGLLTSGGRVAFLMPGVEPIFDADVADVADWFGLDLPALPDGATDLEVQGRQIFATGRLLHEALAQLGIVPDDIAGHSLGEWTGVFTAELVPAAETERFLDGLEPGSLDVPGVVFVALGCGSDVAAEVIADLDGVVISHDNCPHQSVICGPEAAVAEAMARLSARKVFAQELPFRSGFHSPAFAPYLGIVHHHWDRMPLQPARTPLWSATTCSRYPDDPDAVRQLAADHLVQPVRFRELISTMHADGVRVFVQLGVGSLVAFADDTLKGIEQMSISAHTSKRSGLEQLARVAAALWVEGADVALDRLQAPAGGLRSGPDAGAEVTTPRPVGPTIQLELGTPSVHLPAAVIAGLDLGRAAPSDAHPGALSTPDATTVSLRAEHEALLAESLTAGREVLDALATGTGRRRLGDRSRRPVRDPAIAAEVPGAAAPSRETDPLAVGATTREVLRVDLDTYPWLVDHCFYRQAEGWNDLSDRFPVLPMTTMVELLADAANRIEPDLVVTSIDNIRAMRWLAAAPPTEVTLTTKRVAPGRIDASIEGYARATIHLAPAAPPAPAPTATPLVMPRPSPVDPGPLYGDHWMFHGPTFQGVRAIDALGDDGVDGVIESLPTPGAFLDNAGQLYGWWVMATVDRDFLALPQSIDRIERFGSPPPPGALVRTTVRIVELTPRTVRADLELIWDGAVAIRITGWVDRRFDSDAPLWLMLREPEHHLLATPLPSGNLVVEERWRDSASRELMARRYLTGAERATYESLNPREQRLWLLSRIAAKDAVRHALWLEGHGPMFPAELFLTDDDQGGAVAHGGSAEGRRVALGHGEWIGVARVDAVGPMAIVALDHDESPPGRASRTEVALAAIAAGTEPGHADRHTEVVSGPLVPPPPEPAPGPDASGSDASGSGAETPADVLPPGWNDRKDHLVVWTDLP